MKLFKRSIFSCKYDFQKNTCTFEIMSSILTARFEWGNVFAQNSMARWNQTCM